MHSMTSKTFRHGIRSLEEHLIWLIIHEIYNEYLTRVRIDLYIRIIK